MSHTQNPFHDGKLWRLKWVVLVCLGVWNSITLIYSVKQLSSDSVVGYEILYGWRSSKAWLVFSVYPFSLFSLSLFLSNSNRGICLAIYAINWQHEMLLDCTLNPQFSQSVSYNFHLIDNINRKYLDIGFTIFYFFSKFRKNFQ